MFANQAAQRLTPAQHLSTLPRQTLNTRYHLEFEARDQERKKHLIDIDVDLQQAGFIISDHRCANSTYNMWAPGTPRTDRSLQSLLEFVPESVCEEIHYVCTLNDVDASVTKICRIREAATIKTHLYLNACVILQAIQQCDYIALQEVPDPATTQPALDLNGKQLTQYEYFLQMLHQVNEENNYFSNNEINQVMATFNNTYARKQKLVTSTFGHAMLINPKTIAACQRYISPESQYECLDNLHAHLYLLTRHDGQHEVIANVHADYATATDNIFQLQKLADQGITVCGDVNLSASDSKHEEARRLMVLMQESANYHILTALADGNTYDVQVKLSDEEQYRQLGTHLAGVMQATWTCAA